MAGYEASPSHETVRGALRILGALLVLGGGIMIAVGLISFFSAFGSFGARQPDHFWCAIVGAPSLSLGLFCLRKGFQGAIVRYAADEVAPEVAPAVKYLAGEIASGIRSAAADGSTPRPVARQGAEARLQQLDQLLARNFINQDEYQAKRAEILREI